MKRWSERKNKTKDRHIHWWISRWAAPPTRMDHWAPEFHTSQNCPEFCLHNPRRIIVAWVQGENINAISSAAGNPVRSLTCTKKNKDLTQVTWTWMQGTKQLKTIFCLLTSLKEFHKSRKLKNVHCYKTENNPWVLLSLSFQILTICKEATATQTNTHHCLYVKKHPQQKKVPWFVHGCLALSGLLPRFFHMLKLGSDSSSELLQKIGNITLPKICGNRNPNL